MLFSHDTSTALHILGRIASGWDGFHLTVTQSVSTLSREWTMVTMFALMLAKEARDEWCPTLLSLHSLQVVFYACVVIVTLMFGVFDRSGSFIYMHF